MSDYDAIFKEARKKSLQTAVAMFFIYTLLAVLAGLIIFGVTSGIGNEKTQSSETTQTLGSEEPTDTSTEDEQESDKVVTKEETKNLTPLALFAALAGGGWLLFPLKFTWDELNKDCDALREEIGDQADDRRSTAAKMREYVFEGVKSFFGPMLYRQRSLAVWAQRCLSSSANAPYTRLLYSVALLEYSYERLREDGRPLILRSVAAERRATEDNQALEESIRGLIAGTGDDADAQLVEGVRADAPNEQRLVSFAKFLERITGTESRWQRLRQIHSGFLEACSNRARLHELKERADHARESLSEGLNEVYATWYREPSEAENGGRVSTSASIEPTAQVEDSESSS